MENTTAATQGFVTRTGETRSTEVWWLGPGSPNHVKVSARDTLGTLTVLECRSNQRGGPPLHVHPDQDEVFRVLEGEYLFVVGTEEYTLTRGDLIFLPRGIPHTFAQTSPQGNLLYLFTPSGQMEEFFKAVSGYAIPPSPAEGARLFAAHGMKVVGPPLMV